MSENSIELLNTLTQAHGVPGHEDEVREIFQSQLDGIGPIQKDRLGSVYCVKKGSADSPRVLLDSHLDEVGFLVQSITPSGYVKFVPVGGWWTHTLLAQRVTIKTAKGKIPGIIGSVPPHLLGADARKKVLEIQKLTIDIGASSAEEAVERCGVRPGCPIAPYSPMMALHNGDLLTAKAFDNRVGVALVIETLKKLGSDHPNTVIGVGSVQEEVGMRGARTAAAAIEPDVAIILEGPPADDTPGFERDAMQGRLGGGVQIRLYDPTMIANPKLCDLVIETARDSKIAHQVAVRSSGGTDAGEIHRSGRGVPSVVLGVPARYIHSHVSVMHLADYRAALDLLSLLIPRLDRRTIESLV